MAMPAAPIAPGVLSEASMYMLRLFVLCTACSDFGVLCNFNERFLWASELHIIIEWRRVLFEP